MKEEKKIEALHRFIEACNEMIKAENHLAVVTRVDFSGVYMSCYEARELATAWVKKLED